jgi:hypothetical protein
VATHAAKAILGDLLAALAKKIDVDKHCAFIQHWLSKALRMRLAD